MLGAVTDVYARFKSARVVGTRHRLQAGGLQAPDPARARPVYEPGGEVVELDHCVDPPRRRVSDRRLRDGKPAGGPDQEFFDGTVYTALDPAQKRARVGQGGGDLRPFADSPLHAIGFTYPHAYQGSFADLLSDRSKLTVSIAEPQGGQKAWLIEVAALPEAVSPRDVTDYIRKNTLVKIWASIDGGLTVWKWGAYFRRRGLGDDIEPPSPPCFAHEGYYLVTGYVNADFQPAPSGLSAGPAIRLPRRVVYGNGYGSSEYRLREAVINPPARADTFRPQIPPGYAVQRPAETGEGVVAVSGGAVGERIRVSEVTAAAREMLNSPADLAAPASDTWQWLLGMGAAVAALVVGLAAFRWRARQRSRG